MNFQEERSFTESRVAIMRKNFERIFIVLISFCLAFSGCTGAQIATPSSTATIPPTASPKPTAIPIPTVTPISLPSLTLVPGNFYFSINGQQSFLDGIGFQDVRQVALVFRVHHTFLGLAQVWQNHVPVLGILILKSKCV
jgi:hypothetical protein